MSISDRLDEIEARANAATDGPWEKRTVRGWEMVVSYSTDAMIQLVAEFRHEERDLADAEFIAAARADVPVLVRALQAVLDVCEGLEESHRANPDQPFEYGLEEAAHQVRNAIEAALQEEL